MALAEYFNHNNTPSLIELVSRRITQELIKPDSLLIIRGGLGFVSRETCISILQTNGLGINNSIKRLRWAGGLEGEEGFELETHFLLNEEGKILLSQKGLASIAVDMSNHASITRPRKAWVSAAGKIVEDHFIKHIKLLAASSERIVINTTSVGPTGPLLLKDLDDAFGLLVLHTPGQAIPEGMRVASNSPWLPGQSLLVPLDPDDEDYAPLEAGLRAITDRSQAGPTALEPWLKCGVLPFAQDPELRLLRLLALDQLTSASHVLVQRQNQNLASALQEAGASTLDLELDDDLWQGFALNGDDERQALSRQLRQPGSTAAQGPRLSSRGGVRLVDGQGYLAAGLGLPLLAVPSAMTTESVQIRLADGRTWPYELTNGANAADKRQLWEPTYELRRQLELPSGRAVLQAVLSDGSSQKRSVPLAPLEAALPFRRRRAHSLAYREDWGLHLGPLALDRPPLPPPGALSPAEAGLHWAWQQLHQSDYSVNHLFEQQMLESLSALFQRRASLLQREFKELYSQLRNKPKEWPGFAEAVLRGWCEGGWLEEGLERPPDRWRIQPVDPRLVQLEEGGGAQLVGLLSARRLMAVLAWAHQLQLTVHSVLPACADMPRGWRFTGDVEQLAEACGLPLMEQAAWVQAPTSISWTLDSWKLEQPLPSDGGASWPTGQRGRRQEEHICGRRGDHHWKPVQPLPEGCRAPVSLKIEAESTATGKRRWHSFDQADRCVDFSSCHRNRVNLRALMVKTDGLWPFGFTDENRGQIDRLYDAEAYLPLPIGRYAALTGSRMPGPTRHQPSDHTYRYHVAPSLLRKQRRMRLLPLTDCPA